MSVISLKVTEMSVKISHQGKVAQNCLLLVTYLCLYGYLVIIIIIIIIILIHQVTDADVRSAANFTVVTLTLKFCGQFTFSFSFSTSSVISPKPL